MSIQINLKHIALLLLGIMLTNACQSSPKHVPSLSIKFTLIGNVYPSSPFKPYNPAINKLISQVNRTNPVFILHTGNIIYGGASYMGIRENDITRQLDSLQQAFSKFRSAYYLIMGEKDFFNNSLDLCSNFHNKNNYYSFNYASVHFIILDNNQKKGELATTQLEWLQNDLDTNKKAQAILIFAYNPFFIPTKYQHFSHISFKNAKMLHTLFSKYPVLAVFSAAIPNNFNIEKDSIQYINRFCYPLNKRKAYKKYNYYIVEFSHNSLNVQGKKI